MYLIDQNDEILSFLFFTYNLDICQNLISLKPVIFFTTIRYLYITMFNSSYLGGPPLTSHLYRPLVSRLVFFRIILVGDDRSSTLMPDTRKIVYGGVSGGKTIIILICNVMNIMKLLWINVMHIRMHIIH